MNILRKVLTGVILLLAISLSACGSSTSPTEAPNTLDTAVAMTVAAVLTSVPPTIAASPTPSPTSIPISIPVFTPTQIPTLPWYYYSNTGDCNDSAFIKDITISDGTALVPDEPFVKTWKLQNTGSCVWGTDYLLVFISGNGMAGSTTGINQSVIPGKKAEVSISLIAPDTEGTYYGYWQLAEENGNIFGATLYTNIIVSQEAATSTPTATATSVTSTPTSTLIATSTPTFTPETPTSSATDMAPTATGILSNTPTEETCQPTASVAAEVPTATNTNPPVPALSDTPALTAVPIPTNTLLPTSSSPTPGN